MPRQSATTSTRTTSSSLPPRPRSTTASSAWAARRSACSLCEDTTMGSSGNTNYKQPKTPAPPADMIAGQGQTAGFKPSYINFLGDTNVPSTGLTPEMIAQIDATNGAPSLPAPGGGMGAD